MEIWGFGGVCNSSKEKIGNVVLFVGLELETWKQLGFILQKFKGKKNKQIQNLSYTYRSRRRFPKKITD